MSFKEMQFKGNKVFIEVDEFGNMVLEKGRARMKYRLEDDRIYNPNISNLKGCTEDDNPSIGIFNDKANVKTNETVYVNRERIISPKSDFHEAIIAYTDGACSGNPGPAGLGYVICFPDGKRIAKGEPLGNATNNIAELTAIFRVLETVENTDAIIVIHTDSSYSIGVLSQGWKAKANVELVQSIQRKLRAYKNTTLKKVKGHAGIPDNELVDKLARKAAEIQRVISDDDL